MFSVGKKLIPLLVITLLCIGIVEGVYYRFSMYVSTKTQDFEKRHAPLHSIMPDSGQKEIKKPVDYSVITKRNLFASIEGRSGGAAVTDGLAGIEPSTLDAVLMGTILGSGRQEQAIIYDRKDGKQELYRVGDYINQALVKQILRGKVVVHYNGRDEMLDISEARNVSVPKVAKTLPAVLNQRILGRPAGRPDGNTEQRQGKVVPAPPVMNSQAGKNAGTLRTFRSGVNIRSAPAVK